MSNMVFSLVTAALSPEPDIVIAGRIAGSGDLATEIRLTGADALIVQTDQPGATDVFAPLLSIFPNLAVVAIDSGCTGGFVHRLRPCTLRLLEISAGVLQTVLHAEPGSTGEYCCERK
jgi:hypothetical protein